jgi:hypothetical protein
VTDRIPSDHDAVTSHRTHLETVGRTDRPRVPLPDGVDATVGDVVRLSLEGEAYHAQVHDSLYDEPDVRGAFANPRLARTEGEGEDHLRAWADTVGLGGDDPLVFDVVTPGFKYGLRRPGERVVYAATDSPSSSLADIARDLDG